MLIGEFKQEVLKLNNAVNMAIFNQGLKQARIEVFGNYVLIIAYNNRVKVLSIVEKYNPEASRQFDITLIEEFKKLFISAMQDHFGVKVLSHMKDYDPKLELSISLTVLERPVEDMLPQMKVVARGENGL